jgi:hypothetical protein
MAELRPRLVERFGAPMVPRVVEVLTLLELAWHDCCGEVSPPRDVVDDVLLVSGGDLGGLVAAAHLAVVDRRDLRVAADALR